MQVTRLQCGGFILAVRLNHTISDSLGLVKFLNTVAEMAGGASAPSHQPVWQRDIFSARDPPRITCVHHEYDEQAIDNNSSTAILMEDSSNMVHWSFFFGPKEMRSIRMHLPSHLQTSSIFEILSACLWRCRTIALQLDQNEVIALKYFIKIKVFFFFFFSSNYLLNKIKKKKIFF
jgi:hypothetical protein